MAVNQRRVTQESFKQTKPKKSEVHELCGRGVPGTGFAKPLFFMAFSTGFPSQRGLPVPDSFPESSRTSLSLVWFARKDS